MSRSAQNAQQAFKECISLPCCDCSFSIASRARAESRSANRMDRNRHKPGEWLLGGYQPRLWCLASLQRIVHPRKVMLSCHLHYELIRRDRQGTEQTVS